MKLYPIKLDATSVLEILEKPVGVVNVAVEPQPEDYNANPDFPFDWLIPNASRKRDATWDGNNPDIKDLWFDSEDEVIEFLSEFGKCPYGKPGDMLWVKEDWGYFGSSTIGNDHKTTILYRANDSKVKIPFSSFKEMCSATPEQNVKYPKDFEELDEWDRADVHRRLLDEWWASQRKKQARTMPAWASRLSLMVKSVEVKQLENGLFVWAVGYEVVERLQ